MPIEGAKCLCRYKMKLTGKLLKEMGFEKLRVEGYVIHGAKYYRKGDFVIYKVDGSFRFQWGKPLGGVGTPCTMFDTANELKSLYYGLTGEDIDKDLDIIIDTRV